MDCGQPLHARSVRRFRRKNAAFAALGKRCATSRSLQTILNSLCLTLPLVMRRAPGKAFLRCCTLEWSPSLRSTTISQRRPHLPEAHLFSLNSRSEDEIALLDRGGANHVELQHPIACIDCNQVVGIVERNIGPSDPKGAEGNPCRLRCDRSPRCSRPTCR